MLRTRIKSNPLLRLRFAAAQLAWLSLVVSGFCCLISYEMRAGSSAVAPGEWPADVNLKFDPLRHNLVMFAHPKCPCTDASLKELRNVLAQARGAINPTIIFFKPAGTRSDWEQTDLFRNAMSTSGLNVVIDPDGFIAGKFGARTSGQVMLFDGRGHCVFTGGITGSRGQEGDNRGCALLLARTIGDVGGLAETPVYGCALDKTKVSTVETL